MSPWEFSYFKVYELWIPTDHMGLKGLNMVSVMSRTESTFLKQTGAWPERVKHGFGHCQELRVRF